MGLTSSSALLATPALAIARSAELRQAGSEGGAAEAAATGASSAGGEMVLSRNDTYWLDDYCQGMQYEVYSMPFHAPFGSSVRGMTFKRCVGRAAAREGGARQAGRRLCCGCPCWCCYRFGGHLSIYPPPPLESREDIATSTCHVPLSWGSVAGCGRGGMRECPTVGEA